MFLVCLWLCWVLVAAQASPVAASRGLVFVGVHSLLFMVASLLQIKTRCKDSGVMMRVGTATPWQVRSSQAGDLNPCPLLWHADS